MQAPNLKTNFMSQHHNQIKIAIQRKNTTSSTCKHHSYIQNTSLKLPLDRHTTHLYILLAKHTQHTCVVAWIFRMTRLADITRHTLTLKQRDCVDTGSSVETWVSDDALVYISFTVLTFITYTKNKNEYIVKDFKYHSHLNNEG